MDIRCNIYMVKRIAKLLNCYIAMPENNNLTIQQYNNHKFPKGFTLIELLIVIAVLGILVTGILVLLNPVEQTRRANDAHRTSSISQLATAITALHTSQLLSSYLQLAVPGWQTVLKNAGEIKNVITVPEPIANCTSNNEGNVCNCTTGAGSVCATTGTTYENIIIWAMLDSTAEKTRAGCTGGTPVAIVAYDSTQQKTGIGCIATATTIPNFGIPLQ